MTSEMYKCAIRTPISMEFCIQTLRNVKNSLTVDHVVISWSCPIHPLDSKDHTHHGHHTDIVMSNEIYYN